LDFFPYSRQQRRIRGKQSDSCTKNVSGSEIAFGKRVTQHRIGLAMTGTPALQAASGCDLKGHLTMSSARICVIGCGYWGKNLIRSFAAVDALCGIQDANTDHANSFSERYPQAKIYPDFAAVLADNSVSAVALATPAESHYELAMAALASGKHVFVEKPLALDWQDGVEITARAREQGRILMVGHLLQYHPAVVKLKQLVASGVLGRIEYIYSNRLSMGKIRREENALWSFAPHDISVILSLIGQVPCQVTATGGAYLQPNVADTTMSSLLFDRGTRAHIFVSWLHPYKEQRLVVIGSKQMAVFEDSRADRKLLLFDKHIELKNGLLEATKTEGTSIEYDSTEPLIAECQHFVDCIEQGRQPRTPGEEGVEVLKVLQACQLSLQLNGEPVQIAQGRQKVLVL
jgi:UDP-2-acetamido-3-amino-2,3-dideoxy-glucuronate N-acetyltransferase